jgi:hyperosmotically inducible periplasmic protein
VALNCLSLNPEKAKYATILALAATLLAPLAAQAQTTTDKAKEAVTDAAITTKVKGAFAKDKDVSAIKINVDTDKGVVKLSGKVKSKEEADKAVSIAQGIEGVTSVNNTLEVAGGTKN